MRPITAGGFVKHGPVIFQDIAKYEPRRLKISSHQCHRRIRRNISEDHDHFRYADISVLIRVSECIGDLSLTERDTGTGEVK